MKWALAFFLLVAFVVRGLPVDKIASDLENLESDLQKSSFLDSNQPDIASNDDDDASASAAEEQVLFFFF